ncbi:diacylglycerol kinase family protein [Patescibacteria group bacterium]|nr:diacylglycerol kinase family protein [Patescibacteria group bacterium]
MSYKKLGFSFKYAYAGILHALKYNPNLQIHFLVGAVVILLSLFLQVNPFEIGILGVMILLVISAEMINTSLEEMTDLITTEHRKEAKTAKDVAAGMVLVVALGSVIVGSLILVPYLLRFFK